MPKDEEKKAVYETVDGSLSRRGVVFDQAFSTLP